MDNKKQLQSVDGSLCERVALTAGTGYWSASLPPLFIDKHLKSFSDPALNGRDYHVSPWIVILIGVAVYIFTRMFLRRARKSLHMLAACGPFSIGCAISLCLLRLDFPHGNVVCIALIWLPITAMTIWISMQPFATGVDDASISLQARIEWVKEEVSFWKSLSIGLLVALFGVLVGWVALTRQVITSMLSNPAEQFSLYNLILVQIALTACWFIVGPVTESAAMARKARAKFLQIKRDT